MLEKIQNIMSILYNIFDQEPEKRRTFSTYVGNSMGRKTLNSEVRKKELVRITIEN